MEKSLNHEVILLYILAMVCDTMVFDIEKKMKAIDGTLQLRQESKLRMKQYIALAERMKVQFDSFIEPLIFKVGEGDGFNDYETLRIYSQEILRLVMLYHEKCGSEERHESVFDFIAGMDGGKGVFTSDDINRFNLGCKDE